MYVRDLRLSEKPAESSKNLRSCVDAFWADESGAVTTDFVVLTFAIVVVAVAAFSTVSEGIATLNGKTVKCLSIQSKMYGKDISYQKQLKRIRRRCGRL